MLKYTLTLVLMSIFFAGPSVAEDSLVLGVIGMNPVEATSCVAVYVPLADDEALAGIDWFNNDGTSPFPEVSVSGGGFQGPGAYEDGIVVADDLYGLTSDWSRLLWAGTYRGEAGGVYVLMQLPVGSVYVGEGTGGGAAVGYQPAGTGLSGWLSLDGIEWLALQSAYGMSFRPIITNHDAQTVILSQSLKRLGDGQQEEMPDAEAVTLKTAMNAPYPNPFNPNTKLMFTLAESQKVELDIYDLRGQLIKRLANGVYSAGEHLLIWEGRTDQGREVGSGVYLARLTAGEYVRTHRLMLVK